METITTLLQENTYREWLIAAGAGVASFLVMKLIVLLMRRKLKKLVQLTKTWWDDVLADTLLATNSWLLWYVSIFIASRFLTTPDGLALILQRGLVVVGALQIGLWGNRAILSWLQHRNDEEHSRGDGNSLANLRIVRLLGQMLLWVTILLLMLDNLGVDITALVTSLGIGGVAVALALQNVLGDLFASLSIALDKPFVVGDLIVVGEHTGTVKYVGLKTTRVQSISGEELVFSNADLLSSRIRNYKRMSERRILFVFGITYESTAEQIEQANQIVRKAIEAQSDTRFDRVHFKEFADSALNFEAVFYMLDPAYARFMDVQQAINVQMLREFSEAGIEFAFPTQTLHVASVPKSLSQPQPQGTDDSHA